MNELIMNVEHENCTIICEDVSLIDRDEWLALRKNGIGGSEIGGLVGLSKYNTPLTIWYDKLSENSENDDSSVSADIGNLVEDYVLTKTETLLKRDVHPGIRVEPYKKMFQCDSIPYALANPDGRIFHPEKGWGLYEGKSASEYLKTDWDEDTVPPNYLAQVQWYMGILGYKWGYFGYLIGNRTIEYTYFEFDEEFFNLLLDRAKAFWTVNILKNIMPEATEYYEAESKIVGKIYPYDEGTELNLGTESDLINLLNKRSIAYEKMKESKTEYEMLSNKVKLICGSNSRVYSGGWRVDYRRGTKEEPKVQKRIDKDKLKARYPEIYKEVLKDTPSTYFRCTALEH